MKRRFMVTVDTHRTTTKSGLRNEIRRVVWRLHAVDAVTVAYMADPGPKGWLANPKPGRSRPYRPETD